MLDSLRGKALLIVNIASRCGFSHQYTGLQALWSRCRDQGLVVSGVPSDEFGWQEPGTAGEIVELCRGAFGVTVPLAAKSRVKRSNAHPFYQWARASFDARHVPRWNVHKYVIGRDGQIVGTYPATPQPGSA